MRAQVVRQCSEKMVRQLVQLSNGARAQGLPPLVVDVDQAALRVTLDVIGLVRLLLRSSGA